MATSRRMPWRARWHLRPIREVVSLRLGWRRFEPRPVVRTGTLQERRWSQRTRFCLVKPPLFGCQVLTFCLSALGSERESPSTKDARLIIWISLDSRPCGRQIVGLLAVILSMLARAVLRSSLMSMLGACAKPRGEGLGFYRFPKWHRVRVWRQCAITMTGHESITSLFTRAIVDFRLVR